MKGLEFTQGLLWGGRILYDRVLLVVLLAAWSVRLPHPSLGFSAGVGFSFQSRKKEISRLGLAVEISSRPEPSFDNHLPPNILKLPVPLTRHELFHFRIQCIYILLLIFVEGGKFQ